MRASARAIASCPFLLAASLFVLAPAASADVLRVDAANQLGADFTSIQAAVDAAQDGDVILVGAAVGEEPYDGFIVLGKALSIVGESGPGGELPRVEGSIDLRFTPVNDSLRLRGLRVHSPQPLFYALQLVDNQGTVLLEDLELSIAQAAIGAPLGAPCAAIFDSGAVHLVRVDAQGPDGLVAGADVAHGGPALQLVSSRVSLFDCDLRGGDGTAATFADDPTDGADAVRQFNGTTWISGGVLRGGSGGSAHFGGLICSETGASGSAFEIFSDTPGGAVCHFGQADYAFGAAAATAQCGAGEAAPLINTLGGAVFASPLTSARAELSPVVPLGGFVVLDIEAIPDSALLATVSLRPDFLPLPGLGATLATDPGLGVIDLGTASADGSASVALLVPNFGVTSLEFVAQIAAFDVQTGTIALSNPTATVLVQP